jgi:glutathione S-transferase
VIAPKPELTPLTGGYRRTPVMQIGSDVYIDTQIMLAEIDSRFPEPPLMRSGMDKVVNSGPTGCSSRPRCPSSSARSAPTCRGVHPRPRAAVGPPLRPRRHAGGRPGDEAAVAGAGQLDRGRPARRGGDWLGGAKPRIADAAAYMNFWFLGRNLPDELQRLLAGFKRVQAWLTRMAAIGHGHAVEMTGAEALAISNGSDPEPSPPHDEHDPLGAALGDEVFVMADDYGRDRITGRLVAANPERIVLSRDGRRRWHGAAALPADGLCRRAGLTLAVVPDSAER